MKADNLHEAGRAWGGGITPSAATDYATPLRHPKRPITPSNYAIVGKAKGEERKVETGVSQSEAVSYVAIVDEHHPHAGALLGKGQAVIRNHALIYCETSLNGRGGDRQPNGALRDRGQRSPPRRSVFPEIHDVGGARCPGERRMPPRRNGQRVHNRLVLVQLARDGGILVQAEGRGVVEADSLPPRIENSGAFPKGAGRVRVDVFREFVCGRFDGLFHFVAQLFAHGCWEPTQLSLECIQATAVLIGKYFHPHPSL